MKRWEKYARSLLAGCLRPVPHEQNELDWKSQLSEKSQRLAEHLSALSNLPDGGFLVFGISQDGVMRGVTLQEAEDTISRLGSVAAQNVEPPVRLDHAILEVDGIPLLFVHVPTSPELPTHIRGKAISESYIRSAGQTRRMSKTEIGKMIARAERVCVEEEIAVENQTADNVLGLLDYPRYFELLGLPLPENKAGILGRLSNDNMIKTVASNHWDITNPGRPLIDALRFLDHPPQSRNEVLASFMRRINVCEERGSGIDKVIAAVEMYQLPPPDFIAGDNFTKVILYAHAKFDKIDRAGRIRACYQHCCLKYVAGGEKMSNKSLRDRLGIQEKNYPMASRIIADAIDAEFIKPADAESKSKKYAFYIPYWA